MQPWIIPIRNLPDFDSQTVIKSKIHFEIEFPSIKFFLFGVHRQEYTQETLNFNSFAISLKRLCTPQTQTEIA